MFSLSPIYCYLYLRVVHGAMGSGQKSFKPKGRCHQLMFEFLAEGHLPRVSRWNQYLGTWVALIAGYYWEVILTIISLFYRNIINCNFHISCNLFIILIFKLILLYQVFNLCFSFLAFFKQNFLLRKYLLPINFKIVSLQVCPKMFPCLLNTYSLY